MELRVQLLELGVGVFLAGLALGLALRLLRRRDLLLDLDDRPPHDVAAEPLIAASITSGLCSVTWARTAVRVA
jgi:hypothetical protein